MACEEYNRLHPLTEEVKESWVSQQLRGTEGIVVSATDHMRAYSEQIRAYLPDNRPCALGTDGYGRSDTRVICVVTLVLMLHILWLPH
jgi:pyruvate dehydrogenase E1 component